MAYISCKNMTVGYDGSAVSEGITFDVNKGDYLCIVGENGAGKSTLMKTLLRLIDPVSGDLIYNDLKPGEIGYLPQQTVVQKDFPATVEEIVLSGTLTREGRHIFYSKKDKMIARENMEKMNILDISHKCYRNLSGGQQQRVLLTRALCATEKLLILDEPVNGLDPKVTSEFYSLVKKLNADGISIVMVSHDMMAAITYASHILHIGKTQLYFGEKDEYLETCAFKKIGGLGGADVG